MKHWTSYLTNDENLFKIEVEEILSLKDKIEKAKAELKLLEKQHDIKEYQLYELAIEKGFSGSEIDIALNQPTNQKSPNC